MATKSKRKKTTAAELPEEVVHREVLTRVPIKSVVRFKCVSKSWLSLFSDPQFVKQHLSHNSTQNPNDYDCLVAKKRNKFVILSRYKETPALQTPINLVIGLVGSIRGLVCLQHDLMLSLWNPALQQSREFSLPPSRCGDHMYIKGFGFDGVNDNYKIVVLSRNLRSASVYYSNSDSWIDVFVPDYVYLVRNRGYNLQSFIAIIIKDCPYWTFARYTDDRHDRDDRHLVEPQVLSSTSVYLIAVKFDAGSNEFKLLPEFYFDLRLHEESCAFTFEFVDMNDCLTLILYDRYSSKCMLDIYSLDGEDGCCVWSKMYSIGPLDFHRRHSLVSQGFYGGEIVFHNEGMFSCYDHKTDTIKRLSTSSTTFSFVSCFRYTPSLVFLQGMKSVYLTTQTRRTTGLCSRVPRRLINSLRN